MAALAVSDILLRYSVTTGSAGNSTAGTQAGSLGKYASTTSPTDNSLNNYFGDYTAADNAGLVVKYRCLFVLNNHATASWNAVGVYVGSETAGGVATTLSWDTTGATAKGSSSAQAKTIANELTAPTSQSFAAGSVGSPLLLGTALAAGQVAAVWVKLTGTNSAAVTPDNIPLQFVGTT